MKIGSISIIKSVTIQGSVVAGFVRSVVDEMEISSIVSIWCVSIYKRVFFLLEERSGCF